MIVSLNEIESAVYKAVRGAGRTWGEAEDVAAAARWLAAHELPWCASLLDVLTRPAGRLDLSAGELRPAAGVRQACPLAAGLVVSDVLSRYVTLTIRDVAWPLWIVPFAARHAEGRHRVELVGDGLEVTLTSEWADVPASLCRLSESALLRVAVGEDGRAQSTGRVVRWPRSAAPEVDADAWRALDALGTRTYVPASTQSRVSGAGAGLSDND